MRIPGTPEMQEIWDVHLSEAVTGQLSAQKALDKTYKDWKRIIKDYGKDTLLKLYQESIGYKP
jgi:multiple sugar transport system substrate-binding protein